MTPMPSQPLSSYRQVSCTDSMLSRGLFAAQWLPLPPRRSLRPRRRATASSRSSQASAMAGGQQQQALGQRCRQDGILACSGRCSSSFAESDSEARLQEERPGRLGHLKERACCSESHCWQETLQPPRKWAASTSSCRLPGLLRAVVLLATTAAAAGLTLSASLQTVVVSSECARRVAQTQVQASPDPLLLLDSITVGSASPAIITPDSSTFGITITGDAGAAEILSFAMPPPPAQAAGSPSSASVFDVGDGVQWATTCCSVGCPTGPGCRTYCSVGGAFVTRVLTREESESLQLQAPSGSGNSSSDAAGSMSLSLSGTVATQFLSTCLRHVPFALKTADTSSGSATVAGSSGGPSQTGFLQTGSLTISSISFSAALVPPVALQVHVAHSLSASQACDPLELAALAAYAARLNARTPTPTRTATASPGYEAELLLRGASVADSSESGSGSSSGYKWSMDQTVIAATTGAVLTIVLGSVALYTARRLSVRPTVEEAR